MFRRRVFYDAVGQVARMYSMSGALNPDYTAEQEKQEFGLQGYECLEWAERDEAIEAAFIPFDIDGNPRDVGVSVDVSAMPHKLVFTYSPNTDSEVEGL